MQIAAALIFAIFSITGFVAIFFTTFGTFIILVGAVIYSLMTRFEVLEIKTLIVIFALYLTGEAMEYLTVILGAKGFGASNVSIAGALLGGVVGAVLGAAFFGVGLILGTFIGIFLGAVLVEFIIKRDLVKSLKAGAGSLLGRFGSIFAKIIIALVMFAIMLPKIASSLNG